MSRWLCCHRVMPCGQVIKTCLTKRKLSTGNVVVPYKVGEARHTRDAMTKTLYALLFEWIIKQINRTLEVRGRRSAGESCSFDGIHRESSRRWFSEAVCGVLSSGCV